MNDIPDWAGKRACELLNAEGPAYLYDWPNDGMSMCVRTVARLVMQHETQPADPDEEAVKRIFDRSGVFDSVDAYFERFPHFLVAAVAQYKQEKANG